MNNSHEKKARRIAALLAGYMRDTLTPAEHDELDEWVGASDKNMRLFEELTDEKRVQLALEILNDNSDTGLVTTLNDDEEFIYPKRTFFQRIHPAIKVAASVVLVAGLGLGAWYYLKNNNTGKATNSPLANVSTQSTQLEKIVPGGDNAVLQPEDNNPVILNKVNDGVVIKQGNVQITKKDNQLSYAVFKHETPSNFLMNTLTTPRGGNYSVKLEDGSIVWLNSQSSLVYPAEFSQDERRVTLIGEGYFEIATEWLSPGVKKPFIVQVIRNNTMSSIEVLGTHFNVKSYGDESALIATLLEGKIKLRSSNKTVELYPNQQASINSNGDVKIAKNIQAEQYAFWKNKVIKVNEGDLESTLHTISRWYDVELVIINPTNKPLTSSYSGYINLKNSLADNLKSLETNNTNTPHTSFNLENRKLTVTVTPS